MDPDRRLAVVSVAQLGCGLGGLAIALRRGHAYDFLMLHGREETIGRDAWLIGTALSAPGWMLASQAVTSALLLTKRPPVARRILGVQGAAMIIGATGEVLVRQRLRRGGWDRVETPLVAAGLALAGTMACLAAVDCPKSAQLAGHTVVTPRHRTGRRQPSGW